MLGSYRDTWRATGPAGRRFLTGGVLYAVRMMTFTVSFPLFLKAKGFDSGDIGWLVGGAALSLFVFGIPVTILGAKGHTRLLLMAGPGLAALGQVVILVAADGAFMLTFFGSLLTGMVGTMFWILGDPLLAATTPPSHRAHVFALKFSLFTGGMSLGGGLGGWIPAGLESFAGISEERALAATMVVVALLDCAQSIAYALIPAGAVPRPAPRIATAVRTAGTRSWAPFLLLLLFAMPEAGMAMGHNSIRPFLPLFFEERLGLSTGVIGTVMASLALCGGIGALFIPSVAGRLGNIRSVGILRAFSAGMVALCFTGVGTAAVIALLFAYYSVADGTEATFITESMDRIPTDRRTTFSGIYAMVWSASSFAAAAASGFLQDRPGAGFGAAFGLGVFGYAFSIFWITVVYPRLPNPGSRHGSPAKDAEPLREELVVARE